MDLVIGGRRWRFVSATPYVKKNGSVVQIHTYETDCAKCGTPFQITASENCLTTESTKSFGLVHCKAHRLRRADACARARTAVKAYWKAVRRGEIERPQMPYAKVTPELRAEIKAYAAQGLRPQDLVLVYDLSLTTLYNVIKARR